MVQAVLPLCAALSKDAYKENASAASSLRTRDQICSVTSVVDLSGASLKQIMGLKGHIQPAADLATAHYPENNEVTLIINGPAWFSTIWGWIEVRS